MKRMSVPEINDEIHVELSFLQSGKKGVTAVIYIQAY